MNPEILDKVCTIYKFIQNYMMHRKLPGYSMRSKDSTQNNHVIFELKREAHKFDEYPSSILLTGKQLINKKPFVDIAYAWPLGQPIEIVERISPMMGEDKIKIYETLEFNILYPSAYTGSFYVIVRPGINRLQPSETPRTQSLD